jgi:Na+-transporting NADH:ubiquinone oxidoreductase subunit NqrC
VKFVITVIALCFVTSVVNAQTAVVLEVKQRNLFDPKVEVLTLNSRAITSLDLKTVRSLCLNAWLSDFRIPNHCEVQQVESLRKLAR